MHCQFLNRNKDTFRYIKKTLKNVAPRILVFSSLLFMSKLHSGRICICPESFIFLICSLYKNFILGVHPDHIHIGGRIFKEPTHAHLVCISIFAINKDKKGSKKGIAFWGIGFKKQGV